MDNDYQRKTQRSHRRTLSTTTITTFLGAFIAVPVPTHCVHMAATTTAATHAATGRWSPMKKMQTPISKNHAYRVKKFFPNSSRRHVAAARHCGCCGGVPVPSRVVSQSLPFAPLRTPSAWFRTVRRTALRGTGGPTAPRHAHARPCGARRLRRPLGRPAPRPVAHTPPHGVQKLCGSCGAAA